MGERGWNLEGYYVWLLNMIPFVRKGYGRILRILYDIPFRVTMIQDENRVGDGLSLRSRYAAEIGLPPAAREELKLSRPCSVLEVMIALALRCEEEYMTTYSDEDPVGRWVFPMISSLGLSPRTDDRTAAGIVEAFLNRSYRPDGRGGLFYVPGAEEDMRTLELWSQLMLWLDKGRK